MVLETNVKQVATILNAPAPHMVGDGFRVHNFFPNGYKLKMSPFFLLDYNAKIDFSARNQPRGVGVHPHRGFETVTIAYHGAVAHHDSAGNSGSYTAIASLTLNVTEAWLTYKPACCSYLLIVIELK